MATGGKSEKLTKRQIVRLAAAIATDNMTSIAEGYMGINNETVKNIRCNEGDSEAFNRAILRYWANKHPGNQVQRLSTLLNQAAKDCGYVDPFKVHQILDKTEEKVDLSVTRKCTVSEEELLTLAEDLRPQTAQSMKMEPAPWIRDYVVDMEQLYTELTLEKINKKLFREERRKLENYKELFTLHKPGAFEYLDIRYYYPDLKPKIKIPIKGDPGIGKTSLVKKIAWDWAKRLFIKVSIVFFVFLKLVKPGDFIEDAIIQQTPVFEGINITRRKLASILDRFGPECLLILDGLDECALGQNSEVQKIITGSKLINCNIMLTSRPHSTREFERYFDTIISVEGFTRSEARKFSSRIVDDEEKVEVILDFNPAGKRSKRSVHNVPILLSFLCLLVVEDPDIDLSDKTVSIGEIYFRMVQCLYKKFTIRKGIKFELRSLIRVLMSLGKLALETLLSENSLLQRSQIIEQVGEDVFDYGLLIGEDGFSLTRDMTVDVLVTFPHRSLQEFLGAFYFVLSLGKKQTVNDADKAFRKYWKNPLFSEFCLWLLDESNRFFDFPERSVSIELLSSYVAEQIDAVEVNFQELEEKHPALSFALGENQNEIAIKILEGALGKCSGIKDIRIRPHHPIERILGSIPPLIFQRLKSIKISYFQEKRHKLEFISDESPLQFVHKWHDRSCNLTVKCEVSTKQSLDALNTVLEDCESRNRSVYLLARGNVLGISMQHLSSIHTCFIDDSFCKPLMSIVHPQLVNLILIDCDLDSDCMSLLAESNAQERLPKLSILDLSDNPSVGGHLSSLLYHCFPSLHTLILSNCRLQISDAHCLRQARKEGRLPQLRHLDVSFNCDSNIDWSLHSGKFLLFVLFQGEIPTLNTLVVRSCGLGYDDLHTLFPHGHGNSKLLSELISLDMSLSVFAGSLSALMCHSLLHLQILVLRCCLLNSDDLISLAQASNQGRLPELKHLDISQNHVGWEYKGLVRLFTTLTCFPSLKILMLCDCRLELKDLCCLVQAKLDGKLPRIKHLDISLNGLSDHVGILSHDPVTQREISWGNVICYENSNDGSFKDFGFTS